MACSEHKVAILIRGHEAFATETNDEAVRLVALADADADNHENKIHDRPVLPWRCKFSFYLCLFRIYTNLIKKDHQSSF